MEIGIAFDNTVPLHIPSFLRFINRNSKAIRCHEIKLQPAFKSVVVNGDKELKRIGALLPDGEKNNTLSLIVTSVPFDNNYFFKDDGKLAILSLSGWQFLTSLPMANGVAFFLSKILIKYRLRLGINHDEPVGCISDFLWDKKGIDIGMRASFLCDKCREHSANDENIKSQEFRDIMVIMNNISAAFRNGEDVLNEKFLVNRMEPSYDVFMCHNSNDKPAVRQLNSMLRSANVRTWLDEDQIKPGDIWQDKLEAEISRIASCNIIVGDSGIGPWQDNERRAFINEFSNRRSKVIPVLIDSPNSIPELPLFLRQFMWCDLRQDDGHELAKLIAALRPQ